MLPSPVLAAPAIRQACTHTHIFRHTLIPLQTEIHLCEGAIVCESNGRCFLFRGAATYAGAVDCHGSHMLNAYPTLVYRIHRSTSVLPCAEHRFSGSHPPNYFLRSFVVCGHATMCFSPMLRIQKDSVQPIQHKGLRYAPAVGYAINSEGSSGARAWATCDG